MKMIDRYLFDIGKFYMSHLADRHGPETKLSASVCNRCAAWNRDIYIPQSISYNGVNYRNGAIQAHAPGCIKNIDVYFPRIRAGFSPLTCIIKNIDLY